MSRTVKRVLFLMMVVIILMAACAPAPAATQEPAPVQQEVEATATAVPSETPVPVQPTLTPSLTPTSLFVPGEGELTIPPVGEPEDGESSEGEPEATEEPAAAESIATITVEELMEFLYPGDEEFFPCTYTITSSTLEIEERTVERLPALEIGQDSQITIARPVNVRTGPTFNNRIILTLRPDPAKTPYTIIGGPAYTDLSADDPLTEDEEEIQDIGSEYSPYSVSGRKYKWWQIQSPDKSRTGWVVEASACGLFRFIEPAGS